MTTAVWGEWHLMAHLTVNLPTLLAAGNLPLLAANFPMRYLTFTRKQDFERIDMDPCMQVLRSLNIDIEFEFLPSDILKDPIAAHHYAWNTATRRARERDEYLLLMPPDVAWAGASFATIAERLSRGERAVFMTYLRAESRSFIAALDERRSKDALLLDIPQSEMVELCAKSLHPLMAASFRDSDFFPIHPEMILWPVPGEGFVVRVLAREMFLFDPSYFDLNHAALPDRPLRPGEASFACDSDDLFAVSLAEIGKDVQWHILPRRAAPLSIAPWWLTYDSRSNDFMAAQKIRWHFKAATEEKWRAVEAAADLLIRRIAVAREGLRVWQLAQTTGCRKAGRILALLLSTGRLSAAVRGREGAIVFLPKDGAFAGDAERYADTEALEPSDLLRLVAMHHCPVPHAITEAGDPIGDALAGGEGALCTARGPLPVVRSATGSTTVGAATVVSKPYRVGPIVVYLVDALVATLQAPGAGLAKIERQSGSLVRRA